jgi:hypothetical protein
VKKILCIVVLALILGGCYNTMKYGWLPGGDYEYYEPLNAVDLEWERIRLEVIDGREGFAVSCFGIPLDRNTELEGPTGFDFFRSYLQAMIEANNGVVDPASTNVVHVELKALSAEIFGYGYARVYGLVEFRASFGGIQKTYCSAMADGDEGAPLGKYSFTTRKTALRTMASASTRRALEQLMCDLLKAKKKEELKI